MLEYNCQLRSGEIRRAYRGLMHFMAGVRAYFEQRYPGPYAGSIYPGYMDMTYFAFTPEGIKERKLKIAIVYLHEERAIRGVAHWRQPQDLGSMHRFVKQ